MDRLGPIELADPTPARGEVVVRVIASAVNPADVKCHRGDFGTGIIHARTRPLITGFDLSGVVDARGEGVDDLAIGDEVFGFLAYAGKTARGAFAERVVMASSELAKKPSGVAHDVAAASATVGITALQALRDKGRLRTGGSVLVIGASGGVGSVAVGVAKRMGAKVTAVCSTPAIDFVRELGADEIVDRRVTDPNSLAGPFDVIFDTAAAYSYPRMRRALAPGGAFVTTLPSLGWLGGKLRSVFAGTRCHFVSVRGIRADLEQLAGWLDNGLRVPIDSTFPVRDLARAFERINRGEVRGKIAITVDGGW